MHDGAFRVPVSLGEPLLTDLMISIAGLAILLLGGEFLVRGAASLARQLGIPSLAIGLTVVAFGTSAPELAVSLKDAMGDSRGLAFGNIFGSNLANIGLVIGVSALVRPLLIDTVVVRRELPMMLLSVGAAVVMALDSLLGGGPDVYSRTDGFIFLLFFVVFIFYTLGDFLRQRTNGNGTSTTDAGSGVVAPEDAGSLGLKAGQDLTLIGIGLVGLLYGAHLTVQGCVGLAHALGVPEVIIGLTIVSVGTSLPELVAAIAAVRRGEIDLAVGGVVGSNIFNVLLVCGLTATVAPIAIPAGGHVDLAVVAAFSLLLFLTARTHTHRILQYEGFVLLIGYLAYMSWRTI
jgi:cation:H+ antiporter